MSTTKIFTKAQVEKIACFTASNIHFALASSGVKQNAKGLRDYKDNLVSQIMEDNLDGSAEEFKETLWLMECEEEIRKEKEEDSE